MTPRALLSHYHGGMDTTSVTSDVPTLHVRSALLPSDHPAASLPLLEIAPEPGHVLAWLGWRQSMIGWGAAHRVTVEGRHAIREAARIWDDLRSRAQVSGHSAGRSAEAPPSSTHSPLSVPIAFSSFGFAWATPGVLVVPEVLIVDDEGGRHVVTASTTEDAPDPIDAINQAMAARSPITEAQGLWTAPGRMSQTQWRESVRRLISRLRSGAASKVVMARDMVVSAASPFDERFLLQRLHELYPTTWAYAVDGLIGATPEMLASTSGGRLTSRVLAGTAPSVGAETDGDALLANMKERTEHHLAVESVARSLAPLAETVEVPETPSLLRLPNVTHLATDVTAVLRDANVLDVAAALHPTAAVCGTPTPLAFDLLLAFEQTRRGRYSGPVGWIDGNGEGEIAVALRCAQVEGDGSSLRVFAGGGIMPDSVPEAELAETRAKMQPVLEALGLK